MLDVYLGAGPFDPVLDGRIGGGENLILFTLRFADARDFLITNVSGDIL